MQKEKIIGPCGMNCSVCSSYLRTDKNHCVGCRNSETRNCVIRTCKHLAEIDSGFCYDCLKYPCRRMVQLDARYIKNYKVSFLDNLKAIQTNGLTAFLNSENQRLRCPECGGIICVHRRSCWQCKTIPEKYR